MGVTVIYFFIYVSNPACCRMLSNFMSLQAFPDECPLSQGCHGHSCANLSSYRQVFQAEKAH